MSNGNGAFEWVKGCSCVFSFRLIASQSLHMAVAGSCRPGFARIKDGLRGHCFGSDKACTKQRNEKSHLLVQAMTVATHRIFDYRVELFARLIVASAQGW